jgi:hypothetical protein
MFIGVTIYVINGVVIEYGLMGQIRNSGINVGNGVGPFITFQLVCIRAKT